MNLASTSSGLQVMMEVENIIIKRRRKRFLPPEPCLDQPCARASLNTTSLPDKGCLLDLLPDNDGTRENYPLPEHSSTLGDYFDESSPVLSPGCSQSAQMIHNRELKSVTIHEFLQSATSKAGRTYGRKNRLATTKLDVHYRSKDCGSSPVTHQDDETQNDQRVVAPPRIQSTKHLSRDVRCLRRKKRFAKPLAQRLFEADVFSSGTSSRPTSAPLEDDPAHTSSRRSLQFITSLNLTPSLESRIYGTKKQKEGREGEATDEDSISAVESEMLIVSELSSSDHPSPTRNYRPSGAASLAPSNKSSNHCQTTALQRARMSCSAGVLAPGKKAPRARGGKRGRAQMLRSPFEYAPLPFSRVRTHRKTMPLQPRANTAYPVLLRSTKPGYMPDF